MSSRPTPCVTPGSGGKVTSRPPASTLRKGALGVGAAGRSGEQAGARGVTGFLAHSRPCLKQAYPSGGMHRTGGENILAAGPPLSFLPWRATRLGRRGPPCDSDVLGPYDWAVFDARILNSPCLTSLPPARSLRPIQGTGACSGAPPPPTASGLLGQKVGRGVRDWAEWIMCRWGHWG